MLGLAAAPAKTTVTGVEMFKKSLGQGQAGENVGLLLRGVKREDVSRGQVVCKPGSVKTYKVWCAPPGVAVWSGEPRRAAPGQPHTSPRRALLAARCADGVARWWCAPLRPQKFAAEVYALTKEEGGRHSPFTSNYKPQFFLRTADVVGEDAYAVWVWGSQGGTLMREEGVCTRPTRRRGGGQRGDVTWGAAPRDVSNARAACRQHPH